MKRIPSRGNIVKVGHGKVLGFSLIIPFGEMGGYNTLWRPASPNLMGEVQYTIRNKFYQLREPVVWVIVKLIGKRGRYQSAQLYYDQKTGERIA